MSIYPDYIKKRFWQKVDRSGGKDACWPWTASTAGGYGRLKANGVTYRANRLCWELSRGRPLGGRHALHKCDEKLCCNPRHIYAGTPSDNMRDIHARGLRAANKLTPADVSQIRADIKAGLSRASIAADFGVDKCHISRIGKGSSWGYVDDDQSAP